MVQITKKQNLITIDILGFHKLWTLKNQLRIQANDIVSIYQNETELNGFKGLRFGTLIPYLITAGTFFKSGKRNFWDVMKKSNTIIVELKNNQYNKLYIEVENPTATINLLNSK